MPYTDMDFPSQMNYQMDARVKALLWTQPTRPPPTIFFECWAVYAAGEKILGDNQAELVDYCNMQNLYWWWQEKGKPQYHYYAHIDWVALHRAMSSLQLPRRQWITKHTAGIYSVGTMLKKWKWQDNNLCSLCKTPEDAPHVWACIVG